jgi:hypothetical protein
MKELSYNQKLDLIIKEMHIATLKFGRLEWQVFEDVMRKDIYPNDLRALLEDLIIHNAVKKESGYKDWYWLTPLGEYIATTNYGYEAKEKEEALMVTNSTESLKLGKRNFWLNIIIIIIAALSLIVSLIAIFIAKNKS